MTLLHNIHDALELFEKLFTLISYHKLFTITYDRIVD